MSSIFLPFNSRIDMPSRGDVDKVYQVAPNLYYAWNPQSKGYHEMPARLVHTAKLIDRFGQLFDSIKDEIPYDKRWSNGEGGQSNAVWCAPKIKFGHMAKSMSPGQRRMIFVGTYYGNVVMYDRFNHETTSITKNHLVYNAPKELDTLIDLCDPDGELTFELFDDFAGASDRDNIGLWLKKIYDSIHNGRAWD